MPAPTDLKSQRDKFLAFSFASSDVLVEVGSDNIIKTATGATKNLTGLTENEMTTKNWLDIFHFDDRSYLNELKNQAVVGQRIGPIFVKLNKTHKKILFNGITMPQSDTFYITLGLASELADIIPDTSADLKNESLLDKENYNDILEEKLRVAKELNTKTQLTFFDLSVSQDYKDRLGDKAWDRLNKDIALSLNENSLGGDAASRISETQFSLLHETNIDPAIIKEKIIELSTRSDPEGEGLSVSEKTIEANVTSMTAKEASRAVLYALNEFNRKGIEFDGDTLSSTLDSFLTDNAEKIKQFQSFIKSSSFELHFQPIVNLETGELMHYEALSRFSSGDTQEWIMFCEDVGLAPQFDLAVCEKMTNYIKYKAGGTRTKFSINISGQSIEDPHFLGALQTELAKHDGLKERLSFEITESHQIENLKAVNKSLTQLRDQGYKIALDDFGAGAANFQYLQDLPIDYVKIDGKYIRRIRDSQRDIAIVKSIANMCKDLGIDVIAEYVEDKEQVKILRKLGIKYGQGYLYSAPKAGPDYISPKKA